MKNKYIKNNKDLYKFAISCHKTIRGDFHWEEDYNFRMVWNKYSGKLSGKRMFTDKRALVLEKKLEECLLLNSTYFQEIIMAQMEDKNKTWDI